MKVISRIAAGLALLCVLLIPPNSFSCGYSSGPTFVLKSRPDGPPQAFDAGQLGILWPKFERRYLVVAYRYLDQKPLSAEERQSLELAARPRVTPPGAPYDPDPPVTAWLKARSRGLGLKEVQPIPIQRYRVNGFAQYPNCSDDAFTNAAKTALSRSETFGIGSPAMREWIAGQDAVFQNCGSAADLQYYAPDQPRPPATVHLPPPATLTNALLKFDRQYQVAAANFYGGNFVTAAADFEQITGEPDSPWRKLAPYLVARCYIRKATVGVKDDTLFLPEPMHAAEERLQAILADQSLTSIHSAARSLLDYVEARLHPEQRLHTMATQLASGVEKDFERELFNYTFLLDHVLENISERPEVRQVIEAARGRDVDISEVGDDAEVDLWRAVAKKSQSFDDLTDWVLTYQLGGALTNQYRFERWQATKSTPWLLSALVAIHAGDPHADEVEQAAATLGPDSPAYDTALYHRVRLLLEENKHEHARKLLDANWARIEKDTPSDRNAFRAQRFALATSFPEFLRFAPRTPVELEANVGKYFYVCQNGRCSSYNGGPVLQQPPPELEADSARIFNQRLPLSMLIDAAKGTTLPPSLRHELAARTWLRAAILDDMAAVRQLEPLVLAKYPQMRGYIEQYDRADPGQPRLFALVFMVMHFSGMQPFVNADAMGSVITPGISSYSSWWCQDVGADPEHRLYQRVMYSQSEPAKSQSPLPPAPFWLPPAEAERAQREWHKLSQIGAAPLYFAPVVLGWAKAHPDDPRLPEALHYFVRATRYGCVDKSIGPYSREAFDLLHRRYPQSEWTKKTPYWYG